MRTNRNGLRALVLAIVVISIASVASLAVGAPPDSSQSRNAESSSDHRGQPDTVLLEIRGAEVERVTRGDVVDRIVASPNTENRREAERLVDDELICAATLTSMINEQVVKVGSERLGVQVTEQHRQNAGRHIQNASAESDLDEAAAMIGMASAELVELGAMVEAVRSALPGSEWDIYADEAAKYPGLETVDLAQGAFFADVARSLDIWVHPSVGHWSDEVVQVLPKGVSAADLLESSDGEEAEGR